MIPGTYNIEIYQGDTFYVPLITIGSLASYGGPSDLTNSTVTARVYRKGQTFEIDVTPVDLGAGEISLSMEPDVTETIPKAEGGEGRWDLEVEEDGWVGTPLKGAAYIYAEVPEG